MNSNEKIKSRFIELSQRLQKGFLNYFDNKKGNELTEAVLIYITKGLASSFFSFLLAGTPALFSSYPFGIAFLAGSDRGVIFKYLGCVFAALNMEQGSRIYLAVYTGILALRYIISKWLSDKEDKPFNEDASIRAVIGAIAAFCVGFFVCIGERFTLHSLGALVFGCGVTLCLGYVFSGKSSPKSTLHSSVCDYVLGFCFIFALSKYSIFGFSLGFTVCTTISLYSAIKKDILNATVLSLVSGLACNNPSLAPMFALMSFTTAIVKKVNRKISIASGIFIAIVYSVWLFEEQAFVYVLPDMICGCIILIPIFYFQQAKNQDKEISTLEHIRIQREILKNKVANEDCIRISDSIKTLSDILEELSKGTKTPFYSDVKKMSEELYANHCKDCENKCAYCEGEKSDDIILRLSKAIFDLGYVKKEDLPKNFYDKCSKGRLLVQKSNTEYGKLLEKFMTDNSLGAFSSSYASISKLIKEGVETREEDFKIDEELSAALKNEASAMKLYCEDIYVYGNRRRSVICEGMKDGALGISASKIMQRFSSVIGVDLGAPFIQNEGGGWKMSLTALPVINAEIAYITKNCNGEEVCGDCVNHFTSPDGYFWAVLSDGMGSGFEAALVSRICCAFAQNLLSCGGSVKTVVETINGYILNQKTECSATIDMIKIDKYTAKANFIKCGAVSSMVVRGGHVFRINSTSVPVGVLRQLNAEVITLPILEGDYIIMYSDGVAPDFESALYAADIVSSSDNMTLDEIARSIMENAEQRSCRSDDMSVVVIKITNI